MKKLLLTIGSAAAAIAPVATVVACGDSESGPLTLPGMVNVFDGTLTFEGFLGPRVSGDDETELNTWMNEVSEQLMVSDQDQVVEVILDGDMDLELDGELTKITKTIDFSKTAYANLKEAFDHYDGLTTEEDELTSAGKLFQALVHTFDDNTAGGVGDISTAPEEVKTAHAAIEALTVESTMTEIESRDIAHGAHSITGGTIDSLGLAATEVTKVTNIIGTELEVEEVLWNATHSAITIRFTQISDPSDTLYEATIGTINWTASSPEAIAADAIKTELEKFGANADGIDAPTSSIGALDTPTDIEEKFGISTTEFDILFDLIENSGVFEFVSIEHDFAFNDSLTINFKVKVTPVAYTATIDVYWKNN